MSARELDLAEAVARRVVELLQQRQTVSWLTADEVAALLNVERSYVYEQAAKLGGRRLGDGPRARLRFRLEDVEAALPCLPSRGSEERVTRSTKPKQRRQRTTRLGTGAALLPVRGQREPREPIQGAAASADTRPTSRGSTPERQVEAWILLYRPPSHYLISFTVGARFLLLTKVML